MLLTQLLFSHAKELLSIETCPENIRLLASMYAAEALAMLSRPAEAAEYMQPTKLGLGEQSTLSINFSLDPSQPANLNAKHVLFLNLAIVHILKVRFSKEAFFANIFRALG